MDQISFIQGPPAGYSRVREMDFLPGVIQTPFPEDGEHNIYWKKRPLHENFNPLAQKLARPGRRIEYGYLRLKFLRLLPQYWRFSQQLKTILQDMKDIRDAGYPGSRLYAVGPGYKNPNTNDLHADGLPTLGCSYTEPQTGYVQNDSILGRGKVRDPTGFRPYILKPDTVGFHFGTGDFVHHAGSDIDGLPPGIHCARESAKPRLVSISRRY